MAESRLFGWLSSSVDSDSLSRTADGVLIVLSAALVGGAYALGFDLGSLLPFVSDIPIGATSSVAAGSLSVGQVVVVYGALRKLVVRYLVR